MAGEEAAARQHDFPTAAGILFGLGLGGFFDGIVLHQILQWHHMLSSWRPPTSVATMALNTFWDGIFHASTYLFVCFGLAILWRRAHRGLLFWSGKLLAGTLLLGWGIFNFVEGLLDHQILGIHHVNELAPRRQWIWWDTGFLAWGLAMIALGLLFLRQRGREGGN
ncbi:MAG: DUF2243 domain-containing protein [Alphaproteobacteria bacterium]|nr:DUF2243 domain-containing protein [Alphaproteobacteria bacterium]